MPVENPTLIVKGDFSYVIDLMLISKFYCQSIIIIGKKFLVVNGEYHYQSSRNMNG